MNSGEGPINPPTTATHPPSSIERRLMRYRSFKILFEIFRRNLIPCEVNDEGTRMPTARSCRKTVPLDLSFSLQSVVKPDFRWSRDVWWGPITQLLSPKSSCLFGVPSRGPGGELARISKAQSSLGVLAPCQEFSGGGESTEVVVAKDDRDDRSILKFWDDGWKDLRGGLDLSLEDHRG